MIAQTGYDHEGNTFNITHVNAERLPSLIDLGSLGFDIPPNIIPEPQSKKLSSRDTAKIVSQSALAQSEKNVSEGVATPALSGKSTAKVPTVADLKKDKEKQKPIKITNKNQFLSHMGHIEAFTEDGILNIKQNRNLIECLMW